MQRTDGVSLEAPGLSIAMCQGSAHHNLQPDQLLVALQVK